MGVGLNLVPAFSQMYGNSAPQTPGTHCPSYTPDEPRINTQFLLAENSHLNIKIGVQPVASEDITGVYLKIFIWASNLIIKSVNI